MNSRLRWKFVVTVVVTLGISFFAWYPLLADRYGLPAPGFIMEKRLKLGLDLKGGVQMVLRVNTGDAVLVDTRNTAARLDEALTQQGVTRGPIEVLGPGRFRVAGVAAEHDAAFRRVSDDVAGGFARGSGPGESYTFTIAPGVLESLRANTVKQAEQTVDRRVNELGVTEPLIAIQGAAKDEILLQLPGVADMDRARSILGATALLEWKLVERGPASTREALLAATGGEVPPNTEVAIGVADAAGERRAGSLPGAKRRGHHRTRPPQRTVDPGRELSAGRGILADPGRRPAVRAADGRQRRALARHHPRRTGAVGAAD